MMVEEVKDMLYDMCEAAQVAIFNEYATHEGHVSRLLYTMDELDSVLSTFSPSEIIGMFADGYSLCGNTCNNNARYFVITDLGGKQVLMSIPEYRGVYTYMLKYIPDMVEKGYF